eukprot:TRINITY_DN1847_c0_g1_i2.p1 TRINITY_DN1847_c0_g1~~TRINITY_DN1847_c0_g1_i2.p1  ORF type:complete len:226 (-),score=44.94 TRINITY_DN1847_c0_g1_i2:33-710(-)
MEDSIDGFNVVKQDIERNLEQVKTWFSRWNTLQSSQQQDDCVQLEETIIQTLKDVMWDCDQLAETIAITQQNNVYNITPAELEGRKKFVVGVRKQNNEIMKKIKEAITRRKLMKNSVGPGVSFSAGARDEQLVQRQILEEQDELLDRFHSKIGSISDVAIGIGEELTTHDEILKGFNKDMDETQARLATNTKFVDKLLESTRGNISSIIIAALCLSLLILSAISV